MLHYRRLAPTETNARVRELRSVYLAVFSLPPYNEGPDMADRFVGWIEEESRLPGFDMIAAFCGESIIGFAYGYVKPAGQWWRGTDRPVSRAIKNADKFAVMEWVVIPDKRGQGIGRRLMDNLLINRNEPYATLTVNPAANARVTYEKWGWRHVASTKAGRMPSMHVMLREL